MTRRTNTFSYQNSTSSTARHNSSLLKFIALSALVIWVVLRIVLWVDLGVQQLSIVETLKAFAIGTWFDLNALVYLIAPMLIISILIPNKLRTQKWFPILCWAISWIVLFSLIFGAVSEFIFWQEFTTRFNFIAVDYLIYTHEVIGNIQESYPVPLILSIIAGIGLVIVLIVRRYLAFNNAPVGFSRKALWLFFAIVLPIISFKLTNVDQMEFSQNAYANELAGNGLFSFSAAARRNELDYDKFYKTIPEAQAVTTLKALGLDRAPNATDKNTAEAGINDKTAAISALGPFKRKPKNIILISVESLSAEYVGAYGSKENLTPVLDKLAQESLVFDKLFATGTRTVRGLDALSIGIPPIPGQAIVHRPNNEHMATIGEFLRKQDYETYFIYGGYGVFDNMNAYFRGNNYKVVDRTDFDKNTIQSENVWGVDDESLFENSIKIFDENSKSNKPFFAHIMTTSNHRPFTFPEGKIDLPQGKRAGAVKYTDYAIGQLIEKAKTKPWFKDTLFVIVADHCASVAGKTKLPVAKYHIPLFFYAPDMLPAGHYTRLASQIDIVPTLLDVLGAQGKEHFYGQSMFVAAAQKQPERAFISNYQQLGYYKNNMLIALSPKKKIEAYKVDPLTFDETPAEIDPALVNEAVAYYQTANRDFKKGALKLAQ